MVKSKEIVRTATNIIKKDMIGYLLYQKQYMVAFTESFNHADIFAIKRSHYTIEIEVKNTKDDLRKEINSIKHLAKNDEDTDYFAGGPPKNGKKYYKHLEYISGRHQYEHIIPNEFAFIVPEDLLEFAAAGIRGTPYGLFCYMAGRGQYWEQIDDIIVPQKIHDKKYDFNSNLEILYRASNECQFLREKMFGGWPEDSDRVSEIKMINF